MNFIELYELKDFGVSEKSEICQDKEKYKKSAKKGKTIFSYDTD